jgi:hypothetical protein
MLCVDLDRPVDGTFADAATAVSDGILYRLFRLTVDLPATSPSMTVSVGAEPDGARDGHRGLVCGCM